MAACTVPGVPAPAPCASRTKPNTARRISKHQRNGRRFRTCLSLHCQTFISSSRERSIALPFLSITGCRTQRKCSESLDRMERQRSSVRKETYCWKRARVHCNREEKDPLFLRAISYELGDGRNPNMSLLKQNVPQDTLSTAWSQVIFTVTALLNQATRRGDATA